MAATFDTLAKDALVLPPDQQVALAHRLLLSVDPTPDPAADDAWEQEIAERISQADSGEVSLVPASEVFARLRQLAPDRS